MSSVAYGPGAQAPHGAALRRSLCRLEYRWGALLLALTMLVASTSRLPLLDELDAVKLGINAAEFISTLLLLVAARRSAGALALAAVLLCVLAARITSGVLVATLLHDQPPVLALQEARFGAFIFTIPIWYALVRESSERTLLRYSLAFTILLTVVDSVMLAWLLGEGLLELGTRTENRFMCSVVSPTLGFALLALRRWRRGDKRVLVPALGCALLAAHSIFVTTSRIETLLTLGALAFIACLRWPALRAALVALLLALAAAGALFPPVESDSEAGIAGRDFPLAFEVALESLPWGHGLTTDTTIKTTLRLPSTFFFSDYGLLLYLLRYGVLGIFLAALVLLCWVRFVLGTRRVRGISMLAAPLLAYIAFIPLLDYGTLNGALILALMLLLGSRASRRSPAP